MNTRARRGHENPAEIEPYRQGLQNEEGAREIGVRPNTVGLWRRRFAEHGLSGLRDAARSGKPAKYGKELRDRLLTQLELPSPEGMAICGQSSRCQRTVPEPT